MRTLQPSSYTMGQEIWTFTEKKLVEKKEFKIESDGFDSQGFPQFKFIENVSSDWEIKTTKPFVF